VARIQLALNVADLGRATAFYSRLFGSAPAKVEPGYANFVVHDPPLKLVLIENQRTEPGTSGALNHLGVEVVTAEEVALAADQLAERGLETVRQEETTCCFAVQDKVWVEDPDGRAWEVYTVLDDAPVDSSIEGDGRCCVQTAPTTAACCCTS
jgi:catechol-2,3-dioxygenase